MASKNAPHLDAIKLLEADHARVDELFQEFMKFQESKAAGAEDMKQALMDAVCAELKIHAQVEEDLFYPAVRGALPAEEDLLNEAEVEHTAAKELIQKIESGSAKDPKTCAEFIVLSEQIEHHVKEEEGEMFPKVRISALDLAKLGKQMAIRKAELEARDEPALPNAPQRPTIWDRLAQFPR